MFSLFSFLLFELYLLKVAKGFQKEIAKPGVVHPSPLNTQVCYLQPPLTMPLDDLVDEEEQEEEAQERISAAQHSNQRLLAVLASLAIPLVAAIGALGNANK